ncbi:MaoC/PaaZ C-terminal domain-containing protein [Mycobacterium lentiflavum]|uniref:MaoC/PaaZ C-terminal domain-containing protein n=1 Tax=Mycobacterium lentiflavum TaxID=141349 RepID=UPI003D9CB962
MPIDIEAVLGATLPQRQSSWTPSEVILYHLGVGAGSTPTDPAELEYTYEAHLKVLPSYRVIPAVPMLPDMLKVPGIDVDFAQLLYGEQELEIHQALPVHAEVCTSATICDIADKGGGALVVLEAVTTEAATAQPLVTNRFSAFVRGEGGFGRASSRTPGTAPPAPTGPSDAEITCSTVPSQALLYRLSGDMNPIHADPVFARRGGFERPILHGLCSYGMVCKAVWTRSWAAMSARWPATGPVSPGCSIRVKRSRCGCGAPRVRSSSMRSARSAGLRCCPTRSSTSVNSGRLSVGGVSSAAPNAPRSSACSETPPRRGWRP